jgi:hypothetical protein
MADIYTKEEAEKLVAYYHPLLVGKIIDNSIKAIIFDVIASDAGNGKFTVSAVGRRGGDLFPHSIAKVAVFHQMILPVDILKCRDQ